VVSGSVKLFWATVDNYPMAQAKTMGLNRELKGEEVTKRKDPPGSHKTSREAETLQRCS
jgi:hypothetical protein